MALFPPGKGGGENVDYGYKGKGVTIHSLVDGQGMPLSICSTSAKIYEPKMVENLLNNILLLHGKVGAPRKRPVTLQADAGYDTKPLRKKLKSRGIKAQISINRRRSKRKRPGRPFAKPVDRWKCERTFAWLQRKFRRLVVRWERRDIYWQGFLSFAFCFMWMERILVG
jgi:transposase